MLFTFVFPEKRNHDYKNKLYVYFDFFLRVLFVLIYIISIATSLAIINSLQPKYRQPAQTKRLSKLLNMFIIKVQNANSLTAKSIPCCKYFIKISYSKRLRSHV